MSDRMTAKAIDLTTYTLQEADNDDWLSFTSSSAVTVTVPARLGRRFSCVIHQAGTGQVTVSAGTGVTINNVDGFYAISAQYGKAALFQYDIDTYDLTGNLA